MSENLYYFKIFYGTVYVGSVTAHTKWEATEKAYQKHLSDRPNLERKMFKAEKIY